MANSLKVFFGVSILLSIFLVSVFGTKSNITYETKTIEIQYSDCEERDYSSTNFLDVSNIQEFLKNENFFEGKISGYLDDALLASIKSFQKFTGIRVDGIIGPSTHKAMTSFDPCKRTVNAIFIDCDGYLAYNECHLKIYLLVIMELFLIKKKNCFKHNHYLTMMKTYFLWLTTL